MRLFDFIPEWIAKGKTPIDRSSRFLTVIFFTNVIAAIIVISIFYFITN